MAASMMQGSSSRMMMGGGDPSNGAQTFECVIQGEVKLKQHADFLIRLEGLLDASVVRELFGYKEYVYEYNNKSRGYVNGISATEVRAREVLQGSSLFTGESVPLVNPQDHPWELRYIGKWERKAAVDKSSLNQPIAFRNHISTSSSSNIRQFINALGFTYKFKYMRGGERWQLKNGMLIESSRMKVLENDDAKDKFKLEDLQSQRVEAYLVEFRVLTLSENIDTVTTLLRQFTADLEPYFIERPNEAKEISISTATLAAESRKKRQRP